MKLESFTDSLRGALSEGSKILTDRNDQEFKSSLERWSDLDLQVPAAIVKPVSEADTVVIVCLITDLRAFLPSFRDSDLWAVAQALCTYISIF